MPAVAAASSPEIDLEDGVDGQREWQPPFTLHPIGQRLAHELHRDDQTPVQLPGAEHVHAMRVVERGGEPALSQKACAIDLPLESR